MPHADEVFIFVFYPIRLNGFNLSAVCADCLSRGFYGVRTAEVTLNGTGWNVREDIVASDEVEQRMSHQQVELAYNFVACVYEHGTVAFNVQAREAYLLHACYVHLVRGELACSCKACAGERVTIVYACRAYPLACILSEL